MMVMVCAGQYTLHLDACNEYVRLLQDASPARTRSRRTPSLNSTMVHLASAYSQNVICRTGEEDESRSAPGLETPSAGRLCKPQNSEPSFWMKERWVFETALHRLGGSSVFSCFSCFIERRGRRYVNNLFIETSGPFTA